MMYKQQHWISGALALLLILESGCVPLAVTGAGTVGSAAAEERGIGGAWDDTAVKTKILWHYAQEKNGLSGMIDVVVRQGRALLTGTVSDPKMKVRAVQLAWKVKGVREVVDEIHFGQESAGDYANDSWLTTKVKTALLFRKDVHSINYNVQTIKGVLYLMGVAPNEAEKKRVISTVRRIEGVKEVVSLVEVGRHPTKEEK
jgi:osmotically-inducible protein OsmY